VKLEDLKLDLQNPGAAPLPVKLVIVIAVCIGIFIGMWQWQVVPQREKLRKAEQQEIDLKNTFEAKQTKAANLDALKQQMQQMQVDFGEMLKQLPNQTEVAALLVDISQTGLAAGLEFELFKPGKETPSEFYAELPIEIRVAGTYHQFGEFISGMAALPRIVTAHNINIDRGKGADKLVMTTTAKTYRALEEEEIGSAAPDKAKTKAKAKGK
jgi:type IV pilus assembly protein PilO